MKVTLQQQIDAVKLAIRETESPAMRAVLNTLQWLERNADVIRERGAGYHPETSNGLDEK